MMKSWMNFLNTLYMWKNWNHRLKQDDELCFIRVILWVFYFEDLEKRGVALNPLLANIDFCCLLITFANSVNPDQDGQNVGSDLNPTCLKLIVFLW